MEGGVRELGFIARWLEGAFVTLPQLAEDGMDGTGTSDGCARGAYALTRRSGEHRDIQSRGHFYVHSEVLAATTISASNQEVPYLCVLVPVPNVVVTVS